MVVLTAHDAVGGHLLLLLDRGVVALEVVCYILTAAVFRDATSLGVGDHPTNGRDSIRNSLLLLEKSAIVSLLLRGASTCRWGIGGLLIYGILVELVGRLELLEHLLSLERVVDSRSVRLEK